MKANLPTLTSLLREPPPDFVFEVSEAGISAARARKFSGVAFEALPPGAISASPLRDNILDSDAVARAVQVLAPSANARKRRTAALILPDYTARLVVVDFDSLPDKPEEQEALIRFRMKRSVPFDVESAALSFWRQSSPGGKSYEVIVALTPPEIIARYETPFRAANIHPGFVTLSSLAALELVTPEGITAIAKVNGHVLTVTVVHQGVVKLIRSLELTEFSLAEISADLYPTFIYIEDTFHGPAAKLVLCGFGELESEALSQFRSELGIPVELLHSRLAALNGQNAGLLGYVQGTVAQAVAA